MFTWSRGRVSDGLIADINITQVQSLFPDVCHVFDAYGQLPLAVLYGDLEAVGLIDPKAPRPLTTCYREISTHPILPGPQLLATRHDKIFSPTAKDRPMLAHLTKLLMAFSTILIDIGSTWGDTYCSVVRWHWIVLNHLFQLRWLLDQATDHRPREPRVLEDRVRQVFLHAERLKKMTAKMEVSFAAIPCVAAEHLGIDNEIILPRIITAQDGKRLAQLRYTAKKEITDMTSKLVALNTKVIVFLDGVRNRSCEVVVKIDRLGATFGQLLNKERDRLPIGVEGQTGPLETAWWPSKARL
ncbi:hypothetical protein NM208_g9583 [Fusarium decemcellulare]|uniref:Uncharacterized protein n=1 Tax=Fusarium decemcellulare TaxID=57161 RepID=A0ACC1S111_9HYPO|nr:hypothetical protein NM208_g9583 [Fusarium decemcellulare]